MQLLRFLQAPRRCGMSTRAALWERGGEKALQFLSSCREESDVQNHRRQQWRKVQNLLYIFPAENAAVTEKDLSLFRTRTQVLFAAVFGPEITTQSRH